MRWSFSLLVRIIVALIIIVVVSIAINHWEGTWIAVFYTTVLALFPNEIRSVLNKFLKGGTNSRIRVTCSYHFRIMNSNYSYLLVDEHKDNIYRPVGGVYKYDSMMDVAAEFEAEYDGLHGVVDDTENDLRLIIGHKQEKKFFDWFASKVHRETINNLSREFREELLDSKILDSNAFKKLTYSYVGSCKEQSFHEKLGIPQVQYYDVVSVQLSEDQQSILKKVARVVHGKDKPAYIFATQEEITRGYAEYNGEHYNISSSAKLILVRNASSLDKDSRLTGTYSTSIS